MFNVPSQFQSIFSTIRYVYYNKRIIVYDKRVAVKHFSRIRDVRFIVFEYCRKIGVPRHFSFTSIFMHLKEILLLRSLNFKNCRELLCFFYSRNVIFSIIRCSIGLFNSTKSWTFTKILLLFILFINEPLDFWSMSIYL